MSVPYTFASATTSLPLSQLDSNFSYFADAITVSSGNVGIGTSTLRSKLDVDGTSQVTWTSGANNVNGLVTIGTQGTTGGTLVVNTASLNANYGSGFAVDGSYSNPGGVGTSVINLKALGVYSGGGYDSAMAFYTSLGATATERMRINSSGNVGIGTSTPTYKLQLSTDSAAKPSTNTWTIASDERIKNVTGEYTKGLDAVCALRPITYEYNGAAGFEVDGKKNISIIAQEAIQHFPECVGTFNAKLNETDETETELYNWNGHALTFALVNAIKELKAELDTVKSELNALKNA